MAAPLLYRPSQRWQICLAFACAAGLHLAAIALARTEPEIETTSFRQSIDSGVDIIIDQTADQALVQPMEPTPPEPSEFVKPDETFAEEGSTPPLISARKRKPVLPLVRSASIAGVSGASFGSVKVLATYAPRPEYPYEARRQRTTGSGLVILMIDSSTGSVTGARIAQSTGSVVLDNSAVSGLRTWRFKSGTVAKVQVPITYTLSGASY